MYCLNAFKSLLFKDKLKQKYWCVTLQDCHCNKDNTNSTCYTGLQCSPDYLKMRYRQLA